MKLLRALAVLAGCFCLGWIAAFIIWLAYVLGWARRNAR